MTKTSPTKTQLSPKSFLKSTRPERFSDSIKKETGKLDRSFLEYHLETLNRKNMELSFEDFAKKLCEKVICPNLLEQTGPVAGGDGKVDSQTFPVSEQAKVLWYIGYNDNSDADRWAFAVSTQETWKEKCKKDIRKIKATDRDYKRAFCVTNRYAKAGQRSELEDALTKETGIDVRILDRSWILDQVFKHGYEQLAIDTLSIDVEWRREIEVGANDYSKKLRLETLQKQIREEIDTSKIMPHQLNWLLEEAVLSKELEIPSIESQGLFGRAINASSRHGSIFHQFNAHYEYAWAAFWWYEDMGLFEEQLEECIRLAKNIEQSSKWRNVVTLLWIYSSYYANNKVKSAADIAPTIQDVKNALSELSLKDERPSNSLMTRVYIEFLKLVTVGSDNDAATIFSELRLVIEEGESLIGFSFNEIYDLVSELDEVFGDQDSYEILLDYLTEQSSKRDGDVSSSLLWLKRGARRLDSGEPYQAIKLIGKSLSGLYREEVKYDFCTGLSLLSTAYQKVGLFWAARANLLMAASVVTDDFWRSGELATAQAYIYIQLAKIELQLGRLSYALEWWALVLVIDANLEKYNITEDRNVQTFEFFMSKCLLNTNSKDLNLLTKLPDILDKYNLFYCRLILLHILGQETVIEKDYEVKISQEDIEHFKIIRDSNLGFRVPQITVSEGEASKLTTSVMGCSITVSFPFKSPLVELAETLLSVIESFFSTCIVDNVYTLESQLEIQILDRDIDGIEVTHEIDPSDAALKVNVTCSSFKHSLLNVEGQNKISNWLREFIIELFAHLVATKDLESTIDSLLEQDKAFERSLSFGTSLIGLQNIMGNDAVANIKSLFLDKDLVDYDFIRPEPWDQSFPREVTDNTILADYKIAEREPSQDQLNDEEITHNDVKIQSLINNRLWNQATWRGTGFAIYPDGVLEINLLFENEKAAISIFESLVKEVSNVDDCNHLRVSIIRHIDAENPTHYRVVISENRSFGDSKQVQMIARVNTMTPDSSENLVRLLAQFKLQKQYYLTYDVVQRDTLKPAILSREPKRILKFNLTVTDAWKVGISDVEMVGIQENDNPIIPKGIKTPPVLKVLKMQKSFRK